MDSHQELEHMLTERGGRWSKFRASSLSPKPYSHAYLGWQQSTGQSGCGFQEMYMSLSRDKSSVVKRWF